MAKNFSPRVSKKARKTLDLSEKLGGDVFGFTDRKLLAGAKLDEVRLKDINVKEQVRTKFNDKSLKDLSQNIKENGLIQPLVVHRGSAGTLTLICGERRFRAMTLIEQKSAPCFILENKSKEELMAIQFSENSSREELHYIDKADGILNYQQATGASERKIVAALGISKSDVHRSLLIAKLPDRLKEAAKQHNTEKYVLIEWDAVEDEALKTTLEEKLLDGKIKKRAELKRALKNNGVIKASPKAARKTPVKRGMTASAFIKAMTTKSKANKLDPETQKALEKLIDETKEMIDI